MSLRLSEIYISETNQIMEDMSVDLRIFYDSDIPTHVLKHYGESSKVHVQEKPSGVYNYAIFLQSKL